MNGKVLVLGGNDRAGLSIIRSLGRAGLDVHLGSYEQEDISRYSKYITSLFDLPQPLLEQQRFSDIVISAIKEEEFDLLIPVTDAVIVSLQPLYEEINRFTRFVCPDDLGFGITFNKKNTLEYSAKFGFDFPGSILISCQSEKDKIEQISTYPLVLKPITSVVVGKIGRRNVKIASGPGAASQILDEMLVDGPVLVQEYFPGTGFGISVLVKNGIVKAAFQHKRLHEPPLGGASSYRVSEPLDPVLMTKVTSMCRAMRWTGPVMFELRTNCATGATMLIEINGRFWGSLALAIFAGVDFPLLLYRLIVQNRDETQYDYRYPVFARYLPGELGWMYANFQFKGNGTQYRVKNWQAVIWDYWNVVLGREKWDIASFFDPKPMLISFGRVIRTLTTASREIIRYRFAKKRFDKLALSAQLPNSAGVPRLLNNGIVLFCCLGNINRSALAAAEFQRCTHSIVPDLTIISVGFVSKIGRQPGTLAKRVAAKVGVNLEHHRSSVIETKMVEEADVIVIMDVANLIELERLFRGVDLTNRVVPLGAFDGNSSMQIRDPYGEEEDSFTEIFDRVIECTRNFSFSLKIGQCGRS